MTAQSAVPDRVVTTSSFGAGVDQALGASAQWVWLLDGRAVPHPDALAELQRAAAAWPDERLVLLSSQLVAADGRPLAAEAPLPQALDPDLAAAAFEHHSYSLRVAGSGSLLVRAETLRDTPPPADQIGADLVWSARLLASGVGLLVPQSVATLSPARGESLRLLAGWGRLLASDALAAHEKPWAAFIYFERAVALIGDSVRGRRLNAAHPAALSR